MDQFGEGKEIALDSEESERILERINKQFNIWGFTPPAVEPLVFDFGLGDFENIGEVEFWIANEIDGGYCGKFLFVFDGQSCPVHNHKDKLETFYILHGNVKMMYKGEDRLMKPGDVLKVDTEKDHGFTGAGPALLLEISKPCIIDDNYFRNTEIPIGGNHRPG